ncbi:hypothetical protein [Moraxella oculi]|uniref:Uncharacterized protein n=1 Tax=Moraxella oculi TaxID=2940516 RepID=A0ABW8U8A5_9GAMM
MMTFHNVTICVRLAFWCESNVCDECVLMVKSMAIINQGRMRDDTDVR